MATGKSKPPAQFIFNYPLLASAIKLRITAAVPQIRLIGVACGHLYLGTGPRLLKFAPIRLAFMLMLALVVTSVVRGPQRHASCLFVFLCSWKAEKRWWKRRWCVEGGGAPDVDKIAVVINRGTIVAFPVEDLA